MKKVIKDIVISLILYTIIVLGIMALILSCNTQESKQEKQKTPVNHQVLDSVHIRDNGMEVLLYRDTITDEIEEVIY